jgi:hypothetical protein
VKRIAALAAVLLVIGCSVKSGVEIAPFPTIPPPPKSDVVEFRVIGNFPTVQIRYRTPLDGTTQVTTGLPWSTVVKMVKGPMFLSIDAIARSEPSGAGGPYLQVQIFVNGILFREANSSEKVPMISVSGQHR